jgi:hypothetical protein
VDFADAQTVAAAREYLDDLRKRGAGWAVVHVDGSSPEAAVAFVRRFGEVVIADR